MKKLILASAIAALSMTAANAAPTIYGKAAASFDYTDKDDNGDSALTLEDHGSRFGLKGGEAITANTDLVYKLEYGLTIDDSATFTQRDAYVGLANKGVGTFKAGHQTSIDDSVDFTNPSEFGGTDAAYGSKRWNDSVVYETPNMGGLQLMAQYAVDANEFGDEGSFGVAGAYDAGPFAAGVSYIDFKDSAKNLDSAIRVSGKFDLTSAFTLSGLYQMTDFDTDGSETENAFTVAGEYDIVNTPWDVYAQVDMTEDNNGVKDAESQTISAGANYAFTKATTGLVYAGVTDDGNDDTFGAGVGIVHKF